MRGERPAQMPFLSTASTRLIVNLDAAKRIGLALPHALVEKAVQVIGR
jgi:ABC-type uncharacterized transport system substrate-binding protein